MAYNAYDGRMRIENVTFSNFGQGCSDSINYAIATNPNNDDGQHSIQIKNVNLVNVDQTSKVWLHRPNLDKINPSDCVDMDCDGLKKNLLTDEDGSFLGSPGTIISQSEFGWGVPARGLGDYRIPKEALADANGNLKNISLVYTYRGLIRDETKCQYKSEWQAYECHDMIHKMMMIESMDNDTESRRLSPVAVFSDNNKYVDLINGPQDHGWCAGFTCQKRVSTFMSIVSANKNFDIYLTSTPPQQLRFRILGADASFKIIASMYYTTSMRIDLYKNDVYIPPTNAEYKNGKLTFKGIN